MAQLIENEPVMGVFRTWKMEKRLQHALDMGRSEQVEAARDQRYVLKRIVDHDRQMIGGRRVLARNDDVAEEERIDGDPARLAVWSASVLFEA